MLAKRDVASHDRRFDFRELGRTEILFAKQAIHGPGANAGQVRGPRLARDSGYLAVQTIPRDRVDAGGGVRRRGR